MPALALVLFPTTGIAQGPGWTPPAASDAPAQALAPSTARLLPLDVTVNQSKSGTWTLLEHEGALYAPPDALAEWRVTPPAGTRALSHRGKSWIPLFALPGYRARFDPVNQSVDLEFSPEAFAATQVAAQSAARPVLSPVLTAAFLNYDVSHTRTAASGTAGSAESGALVEAGLSGPRGVLTSSYVGRNLAGTRATLADGAAPPRPEWRRLETTWTRDFPERNLTLRLGDSSTRAAMWGRSTYFGGIQIARNFALTPGFLTQPLPTLAGTSGGPSTVELYVNDALRQTSVLPSGPFTLENIPVSTGGGEVRVVVRDVLGRETVISRPFFTHGDLLADGLEDWNVELGRLRLDLGTKSHSYGEQFGSGLYRRGLTSALTLEARGEWSASVRNAGAGIVAGLPFQALGLASWTFSENSTGAGGSKRMIGIDQQRLRSGFSARIAEATRDYRQLGFGAAELPYRQESSMSARLSVGQSSGASISMAKISPYGNATVRTTTASWSTRVMERGALIFTATQVEGPTPARSVGFTLLLPLDGKLTMSAATIHRAGRTDAYASVSSPIGSDTGSGWRALTGVRSGTEYAEGGFYYQGSRALLTADVNANHNAQTLRLGAQGGLVAVDGSVFLSRRVQESFALVEVPGYEGVGVGVQGSLLTRTGRDGRALLTRLSPYQRNGVRLDPNDLPFSAELDNIEETVVPAWRSAVRAKFPVRSGRGALIRLVLDDGDPAPAGATLTLEGDAKEFFVARRGEAFVTGLQERSTLRLTWKSASCGVEVVLPPGQPDDVPRIGPLTCKGVTR